jgi:hypothetical protein
VDGASRVSPRSSGGGPKERWSGSDKESGISDRLKAIERRVDTI